MTTTLIVVAIVAVVLVFVGVHLSRRPQPAEYHSVDDSREAVTRLPDYRTVPATPFTGVAETTAVKDDGAFALREAMGYTKTVPVSEQVVVGDTVYPVVEDGGGK